MNQKQTPRLSIGNSTKPLNEEEKAKVAKKRNKIRLKYDTPKRRKQRRKHLERIIQNHTHVIWYRTHLIRKAKIEMACLIMDNNKKPSSQL